MLCGGAGANVVHLVRRCSESAVATSLSAGWRAGRVGAEWRAPAVAAAVEMHAVRVVDRLIQVPLQSDGSADRPTDRLASNGFFHSISAVPTPPPPTINVIAS